MLHTFISYKQKFAKYSVTRVLSSSVTFNKDIFICLSVDLSLTTYVNEMFLIMPLPSHILHHLPPPLPLAI